jgi:single-strand DNA-binding protein
MAGSLNRVTVIGNVGKAPEIRTMQSGDRIATLSVATSESWKDRSTGEKQERTEWHRVVVFSQPLVKVIESYVDRGARIFVEGQLETRKWTDSQTGVDRYSTEIVLRPYNSKLILLGGNTGTQNAAARAGNQQPADQFEDEIPF